MTLLGPRFESHITCHINDAEAVEDVGNMMGWKFSKIDGDALMGAKPYCYLTAYEPDDIAMLTRLKGTVGVLTEGGVVVLREKIERIIYDTKTGVNEYAQAI